MNLFICISKNFLTIFAGEPGIGKTSICDIIASSLGLNNFDKDNDSPISRNRYITVSVEKGWSTKRDLIGYYNPLTKKYDRSNSKIYDGLMILDKERDESYNSTSPFPFIILLDEANLSPIEYYWADFMRAADIREGAQMVNIGLENDCFIPETLRFVATVNNDQTTEKLSPRLLDRAWIVKLPKCEVKEGNKSSKEVFGEDSHVLWEDIKRIFVDSEKQTIEPQTKNLLNKIYGLFEKHFSVSPRIKRSISSYICTAQEVMEDENKISKSLKALDFAIVQKLLPKISGYYENYESLFNSLKMICDDNNLKMTKDALMAMERFQEQNMGYCEYLI